MSNTKKNVIKISVSERGLLKKMIDIEKDNIRIFNLSNKKVQDKYEKSLNNLDKKLAF